MRTIVKDIVFFIVAALIILPAPTLLLMHITGLTLREVLYR
jgi:hypothetical protein